MKTDKEEYIITRSKKKSDTQISAIYLEITISRSILQQLYLDVKSKGRNLKLNVYLKELNRVLKEKEREIYLEYDDIDPKKLSNNEQILIGSVELANIYFQNIIKRIIKEYKKNRKFNLLKYLKNQINAYDNKFKKIKKKMKKNEKIEDKNMEDVDKYGNIKGLIDYNYEKKEKIKKKRKKKKVYVEEEKDDYISDSEEKSDYISDSEEENESEEENGSEEENDSEEEYDSEEDSDYKPGGSEIDDDELDQYIDLLDPEEEYDEKDMEYLKMRNKNSSEKRKDLKYFRKLSSQDKKKTLELIENINGINIADKPLLFRVIDSGMSLDNKAIVIKKLECIDSGDNGSTEYYKIKTWVDGLLNVPFGVYEKEKVTKGDSKRKIKNYLSTAAKTLDKAIFGHNNAKTQILQVIAQNITNPSSKGIIFGLQGPMGNGKTTLIEKGVAKAINRPFSFISLGGATDSSFLEGHSYTYEGSIWGKIVEILMKSKCMNPIIYFDELDKVSQTQKGEEIINVLMHLTDHSQNSHFNDKYFQGIDFDMSKAIFVFSYNDAEKINPILRDRIINIRTKGFKNSEKEIIASKYLLPDICKDVGIGKKDIKIKKNIIDFLIESYTNEGGVRKLKELIYEILREINLRMLQNKKINGKKIKLPIEITKEIITGDLFSKKNLYKRQKIHLSPKVGIVNGLYASINETGGITVIEAMNIPSTNKLALELTGQQGDVMKESMHVAKTVSWNMLPEKLKNSLNTKWKKYGPSGIHIHCPEGATPKDGPSAGGAITTAIISLLTGVPIRNDIAMTGEIDLKGNIMEIGGLYSKLNGAKKSGVKKVFFPKDNENDYKKILDESPKLIQEGVFEVQMVEHISQILPEVLTENDIEFENLYFEEVEEEEEIEDVVVEEENIISNDPAEE